MQEPLWKQLTDSEKIAFLRWEADQLRTMPANKSDGVLTDKVAAEFCDALAESIEDDGWSNEDDEIENLPITEAAGRIVADAFGEVLRGYSHEELVNVFYGLMRRKVEAMESTLAESAAKSDE